ncbi:MAG: hypothetical protein U9Q40_09675 [Campylobacterota bacterium]|nr:hypothetical protein [Campylobacterota bacterium]
MRLTIDEYSKKFKMSKEMINSKLRTEKLNYITEDSVTYIILPKEPIPVESQEKTQLQVQEKTTPLKNTPAKTKTTVAMVISLYQRENQQLKEKIVQLEEKIDRLIDDKEQMLRDEMNKIEQVYLTKDEQLKNVLELMNTKFLAQDNQTIHEVETVETKSYKKAKETPQIIDLKEYLKTLDIETFQKKVIKRRFLSAYGSDIRVMKQNGKLFLNFSKYDYSDLLQY